MEYQRKWASRDWRQYLWSHAKQNAKKGNKEFSITLEDIVIPDVCPIMGTQITQIHGQGRLKTNASVDRIDSSRGYIKGNVQVISRLANTMKSNATPEELVAFAKGVLRLYES